MRRSRPYLHQSSKYSPEWKYKTGRGNSSELEEEVLLGRHNLNGICQEGNIIM